MDYVKKLFILMLLFGGVFLYPQSGEDISPRIMTIRNLAKSADMDLKLTALNEIDDLLANGPSDKDRDDALEVLYFLAGEGVTNITVKGLRPGPTSAAVRGGAATLLGRYGGEGAVAPLVNIMFYDQDSLSIGAAVTASVELKAENRENIINAYIRILNTTREVYENERLIQIVLLAVVHTAETRPEIYDDQDIIEGLELVAHGYNAYGRSTRKLAEEILQAALGPKS